MDCLVERLTITDSFGTVRLRDVSFTAAAGQLTAVVGPPGSGKTALLRAVTGLRNPGDTIAGELWFDAESLTGQLPDGRLRQAIRWVGPDRTIQPRRTVRETLMAAARPGVERAAPARQREPGGSSGSLEWEVARWLDQLLGYFPGLASRLDVVAGNLSQGEQQILGLAIEVGARPRLLAVDGASWGVSPLGLPEIFRGLRQYAREHHAVVICAEENTPALLREADHILILERGKLVFAGSLDELKASPESLARLGLATRRPHYGRRRPAESG